MPLVCGLIVTEGLASVSGLPLAGSLAPLCRSACGFDSKAKNPSLTIMKEAHSSEITLSDETEFTQGKNLVDREGGPGDRLSYVREAATKFLRRAGELRRTFLELCDTVRAEHISPAELRSVLKSVGYPASRVSELATVCFCSPEMYQDYKSRLIGFRALLQRVRASREPVKADVRGWQEIERGLQRIEKCERVEIVESGSLIAVVLTLAKSAAGVSESVTVGNVRVTVGIKRLKREKSNK